MRQASILGWVQEKKVQKKKPDLPRYAYRFLIDLPEGLILPGEKVFPPVRKGDLVSQNALPPGVWKVLLARGAVEPYRV